MRLVGLEIFRCHARKVGYKHVHANPDQMPRLSLASDTNTAALALQKDGLVMLLLCILHISSLSRPGLVARADGRRRAVSYYAEILRNLAARKSAAPPPVRL